MNEVEQLVYQRMVRDTAATVGLLALLGENVSVNPIVVTRILQANQVDTTPPSPGLTFDIYSITPSTLSGDTRRALDYFISFHIFAQNYQEIVLRLLRLFDGYNHDLSLISGGAVQVGGVTSVFDFEGPDGYDESLETQKKDLRFRFYVKPKAQDPI